MRSRLRTAVAIKTRRPDKQSGGSSGPSSDIPSRYANCHSRLLLFVDNELTATSFPPAAIESKTERGGQPKVGLGKLLGRSLVD